MTIRSVILSIFLCSSVLATAQDTKWTIDPSHSSINFRISHFVIATVTGGFDEFSGTVVSDGDNLTEASVTIKSASVNTNQPDRDKHLRSEDFFSADVHPEISFKSTSFKKEADNKYLVEGNLTMNGITKSIMLHATYKGSFVHPRFKKTIGVLEINGSIARLDFGVGTKFPGKALGENVKLRVNIEMSKEQ